MPTYELALMLRSMARPDLVSTLKRTADKIFEKGGFLRKIDNLGERQLPFRMHKNSQKYFNGHAFIITFDAPPNCLDDIKEEYTRDVDILRRAVYKVEEPEPFECTLETELKPPAYRPEVIKMMEIAARNQKERYPQHTGLKYYPFQK